MSKRCDLASITTSGSDTSSPAGRKARDQSGFQALQVLCTLKQHAGSQQCLGWDLLVSAVVRSFSVRNVGIVILHIDAMTESPNGGGGIR
ncbi:unnamed protein product [Calypogeia fissa]